MKIRAYLHDEKEYFYPEDSSHGALSTFHGVLEGYTQKKRLFDISYGSGIFDQDNREVYSGHVVEVFTRSNKTGQFIKESGIVSFEDGCFLVHNDDGMEYELGICNIDPDDIFVRIIGDIYEEVEIP